MHQAFGLLWLNGEDLRPEPYLVRKNALRRLIGKGSAHLQYVDFFQVDAKTIWKSACELKLEGIVSKRLDSPYRSGRVHTWVKVKCAMTETFSVVGYTRDDSGRVEELLVGREKDGEIKYAGTVAHGFTAPEFKELARRLSPLIVPRSPLAGMPANRKAKWVKPTVLVEIGYPNKSADERLRHPRFKAIRDDL